MTYVSFRFMQMDEHAGSSRRIFFVFENVKKDLEG